MQRRWWDLTSRPVSGPLLGTRYLRQGTTVDPGSLGDRNSVRDGTRGVESHSPGYPWRPRLGVVSRTPCYHTVVSSASGPTHGAGPLWFRVTEQMEGVVESLSRRELRNHGR